MNFLFISPYFPENYETFAVRMKEKGVNVFGIGDKPYHELSTSLQNALTEYYKVQHMENYQEMYKGVAYLSFKHGKMDRIESNNEYWLMQDARLRTDFNIDGLKSKDMKKIKYKSEMKKVFERAGFKVARGRIFHDLKDALKLAQNLKYPVIVKPNDGVGANDTYKVKNDADLINLFPRLRTVDYIMEEFLNGFTVTFDGLTDRTGNIVHTSHYVYDRNCLDVLIDHNEAIFRIDPNIPESLRTRGEKLVKLFGIKERFFHIEFFDVNGEFYGLELNARPPGGMGFDMLNFANDMDLYKEYANIVVDNKFESKPKHDTYTYYVARINQVNYAHSDEAIKQKYASNIKYAGPVPEAFSNILGNYTYVFNSKDLNEAHKIVNEIVEVKQ